MNEQEYKAWAKHQMKNVGHWQVDPIHNGENGARYLVYVTRPDDPACGVYVDITPQGFLSMGTFEGALPHMGEATYIPRKGLSCKSFDQAVQVAAEHMGLTFLLALTHTVSPYRSL